MKRNQIPCVSLVLFVMMACAGCGNRQSTSGLESFQSAAPELRAGWDTAVAADKTNNYVEAVLGYKQLLGQRSQLTESQATTVEAAASKLYQRIVALSSKGDPAAQQALAALGALNRGQGLPH